MTLARGGRVFQLDDQPSGGLSTCAFGETGRRRPDAFEHIQVSGWDTLHTWIHVCNSILARIHVHVVNQMGLSP